MTHAQKPDLVFRRNGRVHLNRQGRQFSRLLAAEVCASAVVMLDTPSSEVVKSTGYPLHSPVFPPLPVPCVTVCHHISTGLYCVYAAADRFAIRDPCERIRQNNDNYAVGRNFVINRNAPTPSAYVVKTRTNNLDDTGSTRP